jgi:hypothetical protein
VVVDAQKSTDKRESESNLLFRRRTITAWIDERIIIKFPHFQELDVAHLGAVHQAQHIRKDDPIQDFTRPRTCFTVTCKSDLPSIDCMYAV